jgi:hypothetical protein
VNLKVKLELNWGVNIAADKKNRFTLHFENFPSLAHLKNSRWPAWMCMELRHTVNALKLDERC